MSTRKGNRIAAVALATYLTASFIVFAVPLPLSADFPDWKSEFDLFIRPERDSASSSRVSVFLVALYHRTLDAGEVSTNYVAGPIGDSSYPRVRKGLVFVHSFWKNNESASPEPSAVELPVRLRVEKPENLNWLHRHGVALQGTNLMLSAEPPMRMTGDRFFPHQEFSVELWLTPTDPSVVGTARLVSYSPYYSRQNTFHLTQDKQEIAVTLMPVTPPPGTSFEPGTTSIGPAIRHVVVTYSDGVEILFLNGVQRARRLSQFRHTLSDAFMDFLGHHFKWPLYSVATCLTGILAALYHAPSRPGEGLWQSSMLASLASLIVIEGARAIILKATFDPVVLFVFVCTLVASLPVWSLVQDRGPISASVSTPLEAKGSGS